MSRAYSLLVKLNGVAVDVLRANISLRLDGQSQATIELDPTTTAALGVNETDAWDVILSYDVPSGGTTTQQIITSGRARTANYSQRFRGGATDQRSVDVVRALTISDRFAAFRDYGPASNTTRRDTDSHRELAYLCSRIGLSGVMASIPRAQIDRIEYTREQSYWDAIAPYVTPFDPLVLLDPSTAALRLYDPGTMHASAPRSNRVLTLDDYNPAEWSSDLRPIVTQCRVDYRAFGPSGLGRLVSPSANRTEDEITEEDDGTQTRTWTGFRDLYEDPDNPLDVTRSVVCEQGVTRTNSRGEISSTVTTMSYLADYALLKESLTIVTGRTELPIVGEYEGELERTTETRDYEPDTIIPGRYLLKRVTAITEGLYVYNYSSADPDGTVARTTATPVIEAGVAGTVDVNRASSGLGDGEVVVTPNSSTSQQFATGRTRTVVETYQRNHASNVVTITRVETDTLRRKTLRPSTRMEIGDNTVFPVGRTAYVYVSGSDTYGERKAEIINAQQIGLALGRQIAERRLAQSGQPIRSARITLTRPDYRRYRLGWICELDSDAPYSMPGLWFIRGVVFEAAAPAEETAPVVQTLELVRLWG